MASIFLWFSIVCGFLASVTWFLATVINHKQEKNFIEFIEERKKDDRIEKINDDRLIRMRGVTAESIDDPEFKNQKAEYVKSIEKLIAREYALEDQWLASVRIFQNGLNGAAAFLTGLTVLFQTLATILQGN